MITDPEFANAFASEWVKAWNDRDLDAILSHYADGIVFRSPRIRLVTGDDVDVVAGKPALRNYWALGLEQSRDLFFEIDQVLTSAGAITVIYTNHRQQTVAETFVFDAAGKVTMSIASYAA